jgi:tetratricopeptide (TPR) repeat protein
MRCLFALACCLSLSAGDITELRRLHEKNLIFQLRDALQQPGWNDSETLFYRALIEGQFGHETTAIEDLRKFLAIHPKSDLERHAYQELASALTRIGHYGEAASAWAEALRLTPLGDQDRADTENTRALYESLGNVPPLTIQFDPEVQIEARHSAVGGWDVPVEVNGRQGEWIFDTGANQSTLSESEAARMGLSIRDASVYVKGSTDKKNLLRLAVAPVLRFGSARLSNVVFLVLSDEALYISPLKYQIRGILGLPVLRALGTVGISAEGTVRIDAKAAAEPGEPNMFFDGLSPIVETRHAGRRLEMLLDTGANKSTAYPSLRAALTRDELSGLKIKQDTSGGAGGIAQRTINLIPALGIEILDRTADLRNLALLLKQPTGDGSYRDGVLGMDALMRGFTLDFRSMQFRLD